MNRGDEDNFPLEYFTIARGLTLDEQKNKYSKYTN